MKPLHICIGLLVLAVFLSGCTTKPAAPPAAPEPAPAVQTTAFPPFTPPASLTNTIWNLAWFDDTKGVWSRVAEGSNITATFLGEGKVTGSGGCNGYTTDYQLGEPNRIWFRRPAVPERLCQTPVGVMSQESAFFTNLEWAETYSINGSQLLIFDRMNKKILQFDPL
jgi:heat shock protein HslJ